MSGHERLPDEALVVRCGQPPFDVDRLLGGGCKEHPDGYFGFSAQCSPGAMMKALAAWCSNNKIGWTTVGAIRSAGYEVVTTTGDGNHATVVVPRDWGRDAAQALLALVRGDGESGPESE